MPISNNMNFDEYLDKYYEEIRKVVNDFKDREYQYNDVINEVKSRIKNKTFVSKSKKMQDMYNKYNMNVDEVKESLEKVDVNSDNIKDFLDYYVFNTSYEML
mgnify:CR=1 FL=1